MRVSSARELVRINGPLSRNPGEAFCALLENLPANGLPQHGGTTTAVMVMTTLEQLQSGLGTGQTSTGDLVTAEQTRRLACQAGIIPVVLGGKGEILDLGRTRRLFNGPQTQPTTPAGRPVTTPTARPPSTGARDEAASGGVQRPVCRGMSGSTRSWSITAKRWSGSVRSSSPTSATRRRR